MKISVQKALSLLQEEAVVAIPTETVYGLAASLSSSVAIEKIYTLKGRPSSNPLIVHIGSIEKCLTLIQRVPVGFLSLAEAFWPGPLTFILPVRESTVPAIARSGLPTSAFRVPKHPIAQEILGTIPAFVAPSANISGRPSATKREHVEHDFGINFPIVDGGVCSFGLESTILAFSEERWEIARLGAISPEELEYVLGYRPVVIGQTKTDTPLCPGQLFTHYSPKARLELSFLPYELCPRKKTVVIGFKERSYYGAEKSFILGSLEDPAEVAFHLFDVLRALDKEGVLEAWVDFCLPRSGLWLSISERLLKASGKKPCLGVV